jgi:hypothetical protein
MRLMAVFRWFLVLAMSVVADLANPALPGAVEIFEETSEAIHQTGQKRTAEARAIDDRAAARRAEAAKAARAATFRQRATRAAGPVPASLARKIPSHGHTDSPSAPADH